MKTMNKNIKLSLISLFIFLTAIISFLLYLEAGRDKFIEEKTKLYSYNQTNSASYQVVFKPNNILYGNRPTDEPGVYLTGYTDYVKGIFKYDFTGDEPAELTGNYNITAVMEGYIEEDKEQKTLWKKDFVLVPQTNFKVTDKKLSVAKEVSLKLEQYNQFAQTIMTDTKVTSPVKLTVFMNLNFKGNTDKGAIQEKAAPAIAFPLNTDYFEVAKSEAKEKPGAIEETKQIQLPVNKVKITFYTAVLILLFMILGYLVFRIPGQVLSPLEEKINKIFKTHGSRLAALNHQISATGEKLFTVKSIEDLIKIADEINQPVLYKYSSDYKEINQFYVFTESCLYFYDLKEEVPDVIKPSYSQVFHTSG